MRHRPAARVSEVLLVERAPSCGLHGTWQQIQGQKSPRSLEWTTHPHISPACGVSVKGPLAQLWGLALCVRAFCGMLCAHAKLSSGLFVCFVFPLYFCPFSMWKSRMFKYFVCASKLH